MTTTQPDTIEPREAVAARINQRRRDLGLTVEELAARADMPVAYASRILLGDSRLTVGSLLDIAKALGCGTFDLLTVDPVDDHRVEADSFVIYPDRYADIPYTDRADWVITVVNGHLNGWSIRRGLGATHGTLAMNGDGTWEIESRNADNTSRRWSRDEALAIALLHVNTHKVQGLSAAEALAQVDRARA